MEMEAQRQRLENFETAVDMYSMLETKDVHENLRKLCSIGGDVSCVLNQSIVA
jgi:hypothetical protein